MGSLGILHVRRLEPVASVICDRLRVVWSYPAFGGPGAAGLLFSHVYMYVCTYTYERVCVCISACIHVFVYVCTCTLSHTHLFLDVRSFFTWGSEEDIQALQIPGPQCRGRGQCPKSLQIAQCCTRSGLCTGL